MSDDTDMGESTWTWVRARPGRKWHYCAPGGHKLCGHWFGNMIEEKLAACEGDHPPLADRCLRCIG